jgi:Flp pilus assembly protein TadD
VRLNPGDARAHNALAVALAETNEFPQAIEELQVARRLDPNNSLFEGNLACLKQRLEGCTLGL